MGNLLHLKSSEDTPEIVFNKEKNTFSINGRSLPEDSLSFYKPAINWMTNYVKDPNPTSELTICLEYFNSSSVKQVLTLITIFAEIIKTGKQATIVWYYSEGDDLMEMKGLEFKSMVMNIPFDVRSC